MLQSRVKKKLSLFVLFIVVILLANYTLEYLFIRDWIVQGFLGWKVKSSQLFLIYSVDIAIRNVRMFLGTKGSVL